MPFRSDPRRFVTACYQWLLVGLFALGLFLPLLDWRFDLDHTAELSENRIAAPAPAWPHGVTEWKALPAVLEKYWNDAFGFRRQLIRWHTVARYELGISAFPLVAIGRHSWLFYAGEDSFEQYRGLRPFSQAGLEAWAHELEARRLWLASRGAQFLFVIAPDKQSIYADEIPNRYGPRGQTPADQLLPYLRAHTQVSVLDLREPVHAARAQGAVYARTDTHWNDLGAFVGYTEIIARLRTWYPKVKARTRADFVQLPMPRWNGDLALMLPGLFEVTTDTGDHWKPLFTPASQELPPSDYSPPASIKFSSFRGPVDPELPRAIVFHDSFLLSFDERFPAMRVYPQHSMPPPPATFRPRLLLSEQFSLSAFTWQSIFDPDLVVRAQPTLVIEEVAERILKNGPQGTVPIVNP